MKKSLTAFDYGWHYFWMVMLISSIILTPITMLYGYYNTIAPMESLIYCWMVVSVALLTYINTEVSWSRRTARFEKIKNTVDNWAGRA